MDDTFWIALTFAMLCGLPCVILGFMIGVKQKRSLLASWDDSSFSDPVFVGRIMGASSFITGSLIILSCTGVAMKLVSMSFAGVAFCVSVATPLLAGLYVNVMYTKERS